MSPADTESFIYSFPVITPFSCFISLPKASSTLLNRSGHSRYLVSREVFTISPLNLWSPPQLGSQLHSYTIYQLTEQVLVCLLDEKSDIIPWVLSWYSTSPLWLVQEPWCVPKPRERTGVWSLPFGRNFLLPHGGAVEAGFCTAWAWSPRMPLPARFSLFTFCPVLTFSSALNSRVEGLIIAGGNLQVSVSAAF